MTDLYDELFNSNRFARDKWNETAPDFDEIFVWEDEEESTEESAEEISLEEWLATN